MSRRARKWMLVSLTSLVVVWMILGYIASYFFVRPMPREVKARETIGEYALQDIELTARDGLRARGWYVPAEGDRAVILMNGIYGTRTGMVSRAEWYLDRGYSVVLPDLRGTGMSEGDMVSYGWYERFDLEAAYRFVREKGYERAGAHGISLGAATIAFSFQEIEDYDFVVLESSYDTLDNAYRNRLAMFNVPHFITYPLRWFVEYRLGVSPDVVNPMDYLARCQAPALIMAGDSEIELKLKETEALYAACASEDKRLHIFEGGKHENFLRRFEDEFLSVMNAFIEDVEADWQRNEHEQLAGAA